MQILKCSKLSAVNHLLLWIKQTNKKPQYKYRTFLVNHCSNFKTKRNFYTQVRESRASQQILSIHSNSSNSPQKAIHFHTSAQISLSVPCYDLNTFARNWQKVFTWHCYEKKNLLCTLGQHYIFSVLYHFSACCSANAIISITFKLSSQLVTK